MVYLINQAVIAYKLQAYKVLLRIRNSLWSLHHVHNSFLICQNTEGAICLLPLGQNTESCDLGNVWRSARRVLMRNSLDWRGLGKQHGSQQPACSWGFCKSWENAHWWEVTSEKEQNNHLLNLWWPYRSYCCVVLMLCLIATQSVADLRGLQLRWWWWKWWY